MELKLVYRALRKVSDWTVGGFYSEVLVEGYENVGETGPLIIASTHHNEIIDIATLAVTIPYRRHLSFWAKSTMFVNPITRAILQSSGAIPVRRNPNNGGGPSTAASKSTHPQSDLFRESSNALNAGKVIGVFPEGTSYTQPSIVQVMPGAAWAAVEFIKWARERGLVNAEKELSIVPVGIVYTDKSRYLSKVYVKYGTPIVVSEYMNDESDNPEAVYKSSVKNIMSEVESQMREMTINAPDWDTLHAAETAREILWEGSENISLRDWVAVSQKLVELFSPSLDPQKVSVKTHLIKYCALLHHSGVKHSSLPHKPRKLHALYTLSRLPLALFNFICLAPAMVFHLPAYLTGSLAARYLTEKGETESKAQFKAIGGGVGLGLNVGFTLWCLRKTEWVDLCWGLVSGGSGKLVGVKRILGALGAVYGGVYLLVKWHYLLLAGNYRRFRKLLVFYKLSMGLLLPGEVTQEELEAYIKPPSPPPNPFIKAQPDSSNHSIPIPKRIPSRRLIRPLLDARAEAYAMLGIYLRDLKSGQDYEAVEFLKNKGANVPA